MIRAIEREHGQPPGWWESLEKWQRLELWGEWNVRTKQHNIAVKRQEMQAKLAQMQREGRR